MSVVNKMLQDIDRRRVEMGQASAFTHATPGVRGYRPPSRSRRGMAFWLLGLAALAALLWWIREGAREAPLPAPAQVPAQLAAAAQAAPRAPLPSSSSPVPPSASPLREPSPAPQPEPQPVAPAALQQAAVPEIAEPPPAEPTKVKGKHARSADDLRLSTRLSVPASASAPAGAGTAPPSADKSPPSIAIRQVASDETLRAARVLWADGLRGAAVETLRQALAVAETHRDAAAVPALGRELARMEASNDNPQAALDVLKRLESRFQDDAEAWALRANAQQRLGMHAEAAESYLGALRLKPGEGRWMLGAAISLAALGKMQEARTWVERAAERGPIPPSVSAYLKQLGISVPAP